MDSPLSPLPPPFTHACTHTMYFDPVQTCITFFPLPLYWTLSSWVPLPSTFFFDTHWVWLELLVWAGVMSNPPAASVTVCVQWSCHVQETAVHSAPPHIWLLPSLSYLLMFPGSLRGVLVRLFGFVFVSLTLARVLWEGELQLRKMP